MLSVKTAMAATVVACGTIFATGVVAGERKELNLHNANTGEDLRVVFKIDGSYVPDAIDKLEWFFRDWRQSKTRKMDPRVFDLLERIYSATGSSRAVNVHSGYRSPQTNAMLRSRSKAVAKESQHMEGKAIDFHIPGVPTAELRSIAMKMQQGGVGYYPSSNSPFVHIDVADVRSWPRPSRSYLSSLFPDGKTAHLPSDGRPLPRYEEALAEIKSRKLGILSVIGTLPEKARKKAVERSAAVIAAFVPPIPEKRTEFAEDASIPAVSVLAYGPSKATRPHQLFSDPFAFIEEQRRLLRQTDPEAAALERPVVFKTVEIEKTARVAHH